MDHLVASSAGGGNNLGNRVLACRTCNSKGKRDQGWEDFLRAKCAKNRVPFMFAKRKKRIEDWTESNASPNKSERLKKAIRLAAEEVYALFDAKVSEVKAMMRPQKQ
jgi:hypothetical protein